MVRNKLLKERIIKLAKELKEFTTQDMVRAINDYPNYKGEMWPKRPKISGNQCAQFLRIDDNITVKKVVNGKNIWKYKKIGDE
tara:strand:+ start:1646 stop:1894 length:249 start_codon:yes stop_codon:yes gene_type:complete